jgi:heme A synthase
MTTPAVEVRARGPADAANRIRMASLGALTMLIIQFILGVAENLFGTAPTAAKSIGLFSSPLLAIHVIMAILLVLAAIMLVVRAIQARITAALVTTVIGLLAILGAAGAGSSFTQSGANGASFGMAMGAAVAMLAYTANLVMLGSPATKKGR